MAQATQTPAITSTPEANRQASMEWPRTFGVELEFVFTYQVDEHTSGHSNKYQTSAVETQRILSKAIDNDSRVANNIFVNGLLRSEDNSEQYKPWHVASDHPVVVFCFGDRITTGNRITLDSNKFKVVTKVMDFNDKNNTRELQEILNAIAFPVKTDAGIPECGAVNTNQTGMYVHIQAPAIPQELDVLRELAFLLYIYKEEINRMHPRCRRPGHPCASQIIESNRPSIPEFIAKEASLQDFQKVMTVEEIRERVNRCVAARDFCDLVGGESKAKTRLVSWRDLIPESHCSTSIEFRQHRGTLTVEDVQWWVVFVAGLLHLAATYSRSQNSPITSWNTRVSVFDLMVAMGMGQAGIDFYASRIANFMHYPENGPFNGTIWEIVPTAANNGSRRASSQILQTAATATTDPITPSHPSSLPATHGRTTASTEQGTNPTSVGIPNGKRPADGALRGEPAAKSVNTGMEPTRSGVPHDHDLYLQTLLTEYVDGYVDNVLANEPMFIAQGGLIVFAMNSHESEWQPMATSSSGPRITHGVAPLGNMCGVWAVLLSLKYQYPDYAKGRNFRFHDVLRAVHSPTGDNMQFVQNQSNFTDEELAAGLQQLTGGEYRLVVCSNSRNHGNGRARLIIPGGGGVDGLGFARNVYISQSFNQGHWRTMRRQRS